MKLKSILLGMSLLTILSISTISNAAVDEPCWDVTIICWKGGYYTYPDCGTYQNVKERAEYIKDYICDNFVN